MLKEKNLKLIKSEKNKHFEKKTTKKRFFLISQGSLNLKIRFLAQKLWSVARVQRHRQTDTQTHIHESDYCGHPFRVSGVFPSTYHQGTDLEKSRQTDGRLECSDTGRFTHLDTWFPRHTECFGKLPQSKELRYTEEMGWCRICFFPRCPVHRSQSSPPRRTRPWSLRQLQTQGSVVNTDHYD